MVGHVTLDSDFSSINTPMSIWVGQRYGRPVVALELVGDDRMADHTAAQPRFKDIGRPGAVVIDVDL